MREGVGAVHRGREFKNQGRQALYRKLQKGRSLPDGLEFVVSYVTADLGRCSQLMRTDEITTFQRWIADWHEAIEFEVVPVDRWQDTREALELLL